MKEKVSIIIPVYNAGEYIADTVTSILNQTYTNLEIILIDDGSNDNSYSICESYLRDTRITLTRQNNYGAPAARNKGLDLSKGKYILFFDADDILEENAIFNMVNTIENEKADLVVGNYSTFIDKKIIKENTQKLTRLNKSIFNLFFISPFPNNKLYTSDIIKKNNIKFDDVRIAQDANFLYKVIPFIDKVSIFNETVCYYRLSCNSISRAYNSRILDVLQSMTLVEEFYKLLNVNKKYYYYLSIAKLNHLNTQIKKISNFKEYKEAVECFNLLNNEYWQTFRSIKPKFNIWILKSILFHISSIHKVKKIKSRGKL